MDEQAAVRGRADLGDVAVVFGLLSILFAALIVPGVLAVVLGLRARRRGAAGGKATAAVALGVATVMAGAGAWAVFGPSIFSSPSYRTLRAGDCYERPDADPRFIRRQPCDGQHGREVVDVFDHPAPRHVRFPGTAAIRAYADPRCRAAASAYVDTPFDQAPLRTYRILPSRESWNDGNRRVVCAVGSYQGPLAGSLRNRRTISN